MKQSLTIQLEPAEVQALMKGRGVTLTDSAGREMTLLFAPPPERHAETLTVNGKRHIYTDQEKARVQAEWKRLGPTMSVRAYSEKLGIHPSVLRTTFGILGGGKVTA